MSESGEAAKQGGKPEGSALDRPLARVAALGVCACVVAVLAFIHREDLMPPDPVEAVAADDPVAMCLAGRAKDIDKMLADGVIDEGQAALFKSRAEALCVAQEGQGGPAMGGLPAAPTRDRPRRRERRTARTRSRPIGSATDPRRLEYRGSDRRRCL